MARVFLIGLLLCVTCAAWGQEPPAPEASDLWSEATLYRDEWGVPHVFARTPRGLGFAFGYAQAEDHIEPMMLAYRAATGRLAEVKGEVAADSDALALRMGHGQLAEHALADVDAVTRGLCEGFALGVNAWLAANIDKAPEWAEGVSPAEVLALWHAFLTSQSPLDLPGVEGPRRGLETGNAWAVAPGHTPEGQTVLVINPHEYYDGPFLWTEAHLILDDYDVYGATLYGLPILLMGHNALLGWGLTPNLADTADVYEHRVPKTSRSPNSIKQPGDDDDTSILLEYYSKSRSYFVRKEGGQDERVVPVNLTKDGPLIENSGLLYLWRIAEYGQFGGLRQLVDMGRSQTLEEFQASLQEQQLPPCNVVYGDALGNVFYLYNAVTGARETPTKAEARIRNLSTGQMAWKAPLPSAMLFFGWNSWLGIGDMPYVMNPDGGFIESCGDSPFTVSDTLPYSADAWPGWLMSDTDCYRATRVRQLLRGGMRSFRDNQSMLFDLVVPAAADMKGALLKAAADHPDWVGQAHPDLTGFLEVLANWDNLAEVKTPGMTAYHLWWATLRARTPALPTEYALEQSMLSGDQAILREAVSAAGEAARMMRNEFDKMDQPWGEAHRIKRGDRNEPLPGGLSGEPIFASGDFTYEQGKWAADYGYGFAMAVQFGDHPNAVSVVPFGASDVPGSPHYADQLDLLLTRRFKRTRYLEADVLRNTTVARGREITLYPRGVEAAFRFTCEQPMTAALRTLAETPGFLPEGQTAFGLYVQPQVERPADADVKVETSFYVPAEFCRDEELEQLHLYRHALPGGWALLPEQVWNTEQRTVSGAGTVDGVYAVLGPAEAFAHAAPQKEEAAGGESTDAGKAANTAPAPAPLADPSTLLPPEQPAGDEHKGHFKFDWKNPPHPIGDQTGSSTFQQPLGHRQFKFERKADGPAPEPKPDAANPEPAPLAPTPQTSEAPAMKAPLAPLPEVTPEGKEPPAAKAAPPQTQEDANPTGARQFKFKRGDKAPAETAPDAKPRHGHMEYGLPPHVLERQKELEEQGQAQPETAQP